MIIKSSFKSVSRESNIGLVWPIIGRNGGLVHYRFGEALAQHGTFVGFSAIKLLALLVGLFGQYGLVVSIDDLLNATHIADLDGITVKDLVKDVILVELH